jgi:hypothetical protein
MWRVRVAYRLGVLCSYALYGLPVCWAQWRWARHQARQAARQAEGLPVWKSMDQYN